MPIYNIGKVIGQIIRDGEHQAISSWLTVFGDKGDEHGSVSQLLVNKSATMRFFGLLKHMILTAPNRQAPQAFEMGLPLLRWLNTNQSLIDWNEKVSFAQYAASVFFNYCMACYNMAEFKALKSVVEEVDNDLPQLLNERGYWSGRVYLAIGAIRQLDITSAKTILSAVPQQYKDIEQYSKTCQDVEAFETKRFKVAQPKLTEDKVLDIWETTIPAMKAALTNCEEKGGDIQILRQLLVVTDRPNGSTHVHPNGSTLRCYLPPQTA